MKPKFFVRKKKMPVWASGYEPEEAQQKQPQPKRKPTAFQKAHAEMNAQKQQVVETREQKQRDRVRVEKLRKQRIEERKLRQKVLSRRTKKGQPIMSGRIEMLVRKIESDMGYTPSS
ncbi:unnamed protein product [Notodromas monacha]|uniref:rRNA-processing protein FYV7 n=1 Tax=Notodromas monacha TaxID=399045 RepID=A0A7R9GJY0_9CRUS|nr:unnamed protein product [Notodromas monacha]CAG0925454.1 unnamed protein product [Notodromas monacha]